MKRTKSSSSAQVVVVGSFNVDHVWRCETLPAAGATLGGDYASGPGGKGFNQAIAAVRSGARTAFVCALGNDLGGHHARALATADSIDLRDQTADVPTGSAGIFVDAQGRLIARLDGYECTLNENLSNAFKLRKVIGAE